MKAEVAEIQAHQEERVQAISKKIEQLANTMTDQVAAGTLVGDKLAQCQKLHRNAQFYWDFVMVENGDGAHNSKLSDETLDKSKRPLTKRWPCWHSAEQENKTRPPLKAANHFAAFFAFDAGMGSVFAHKNARRTSALAAVGVGSVIFQGTTPARGDARLPESVRFRCSKNPQARIFRKGRFDDAASNSRWWGIRARLPLRRR